jgi:RHS repeat-associated protein
MFLLAAQIGQCQAYEKIIDSTSYGSSAGVSSGGTYSHYTSVVVSPHQTTAYDIPAGTLVTYTLAGLSLNGCSLGSAGISFSTSSDPSVPGFDSYSLVATIGTFTADTDIPAGSYVFGVASACDASRPVGFVGGGDSSSSVYFGGTWPNGAPAAVYVPSFNWNLLLTTGVPPPPACPQAPPPVTEGDSTPVRQIFGSDLTITSISLWTAQVGAIVYCCAESYLTLVSDVKSSPGSVFAQSSTAFAGGLTTYSFSPPVYIPSGTPFWVFLNAPPNTNATAMYGSHNVPYLSYQATCGSTLGAGGSTNRSGFTQEPINTATGNYVYSHNDLTVPGKRLSFAFTRYYNSADSYSGPLGSGWTHSFNVFLSTAANGIVTVKEMDGHQDSFSPAVAGAYTAATPGLFDSLIGNADGTFTLTRRNQTKLTFSAAGKLTSVADRNGNAQALGYDGSGNLVTVTDTAGRTFPLGYDGNARLTSLTDPTGRSWQYAYDASGNLVSVRDAAGGLTQYAYDASHRMTSAIDGRGVTFLQNTYDGLGRVAIQANARGFSTTLSYNTPSQGTTTVADPAGNTTQYSYDTTLRLTGVIDAKSGITAYAYDTNNDPTSVTDQNGNATVSTYDGTGNVIGIQDALGNATTFTYNGTNDLLSATTPKGNPTTFSYDGNGNLTQIRDASGGVTKFTYDGSGLRLSKTDARSNATTFAYDSFGDLTKRTDPLGGSTVFGYDGLSRMISATDPKGHTSPLTYDYLSRLLSKSDPLGNAQQFSYDPIGNLVKMIDANGNGTTYAYDATNNLTGVTDALGDATTYGYDGNNNRVTVTNAKGNVTTSSYDALNRVVKVTDPLSFTTAYTYDPVGNIVSTMDANGNANTYSYDALNRMTKGTYADGNTVAYAFDQDGKRSSMVDSRGTTNYSYDVFDRLLSVAGPAGATQYAYDAVGNRTSLTYPNGKVVSYQYDALNRLSHVTDWAGKVTAYAYDAAGNLAGTTFPNGASSSYGYDNANRLLQITNQAGAKTVSSFNYSLDSAGNRVQVVSSAAGLTKYGYDPLNRLTSWTSPSGQVTQYSYDTVGNRVGLVSTAGTTSYTYDDADRMLTAGTSTFQYDPNGNQIGKTTGSTAITYSYDALNLLTAASGSGINSGYHYDGDGNRVSQTVPTGTYQYQNDTASALPVVLSETGPDGGIDYLYGRSVVSATSSTFQYFFQSDGLGSAASLTDAAGSLKATYSYDPWGKLLNPIDPLGTKNKYKFAGEALDPGSALYYLRARYYDPVSGRFVGRDPLHAKVVIPMTLNRYSYALANPVLRRDPSGLSSIDSEASGQSTSATQGTISSNDILGQLLDLGAVSDVGEGLQEASAGIGITLGAPGLVTAGAYATPAVAVAATAYNGALIGTAIGLLPQTSKILFSVLNFTFGPTNVQNWSTSPVWTALSSSGNSLANFFFPGSR